MGDDIELGPIDYIVVEWAPDKQPTGEAFPLLVDLVDRGVIRVLDLGFVHKEDDGSTGTRSSRSSREPRPGCWATMITTRQGVRSSREARPRSCCTRTRGRHLSRRRCVAAARSLWRMVASR